MSLETFTEAYTECAIWASTDTDADGNDVPMDQLEADISDKTQTAMEADCADFYAAQADLLAEACASEVVAYDDARAGHDFWLTRNGHGAGFWDRGLGEVGDKLSHAARIYGAVNLYVGDDGQIYA